jgi:hypothetical protein
MKLLGHLTLISLIVLTFAACKNNNSQKQTVKQTIDTDSVFVLHEKFNEAKQVVYSLPSPQEVNIILLENKNITFDPTLLNSDKLVDKYTSDLSRALNLGIYSADISYASLFEQNQLAINYMNAAKKLADQLGILNYFTKQDIEQIENNVTNRDEIMKIITQAYMKSDAQLQEDHRDDIGALILIGGWIEGMYLAVNLAHCNVKENPKLINSIMEQQLSLALLVDFLHYYENDKLLSEIAQDIYDLNKLFDSINTDIDNNGYIKVSQKDF